MTDRPTRLQDAFAALNAGDLQPFTDLFTPAAQWHGVEGMGFEGETPT